MKKIAMLLFVTFLISIANVHFVKAEDSYFPGSGPINVVFLGGSITEGTSSKYNDSYPSGTGYAALVKNHLVDKYGSRINYHNSGIGGTGSNFGYNRFYDDVVKYNPDLVFIEFAVNDYYLYENTKVYMEAMVRELMKLDKVPYVSFVYTAQVSNALDTTKPPTAASLSQAEINYQEEVATHYNIAKLNLVENVYTPYMTNAIADGVDATEAYKRFFADGVHPTAMGHQMYADYINAQIDSLSCFTKPQKPADNSWVVDTNSLLKLDYIPHGIDVTTDMLSGGTWTKTIDKDWVGPTGGILKYDFSGPMFGLYTLQGINYGKADIYIDGNFIKTIDSYKNQGYEQRNLGFYKNNLENKEHTVRIVLNGAIKIRKIYIANGSIDCLNNFCVDNIVITDSNGNSLNTIQPGVLNIANITMQNVTLTDIPYSAIVAIYNNGVLSGISNIKDTLATGKTGKYGVGFTANSEGTIMIKAMVWNDINKMNPLIKIKNINTAD